jgi:hypothetical protein
MHKRGLSLFLPPFSLPAYMGSSGKLKIPYLHKNSWLKDPTHEVVRSAKPRKEKNEQTGERAPYRALVT